MSLPRIDIGIDRDERLPACLFLIFVVMLCIAGGASRGDVLAQPLIRVTAVALMLVQVIAGRMPDIGRYRACAALLAAMIAIAALQLIPLPPAIWSAFPGRAIIATSPLGAAGWRPLNLVPDAGWNAHFSLLVPLCVLVLLSSLRPATVWRAQYLLIGAAIFSALLALLQASGSAPDNPVINGTTIDYAGLFANRNHQALFLAIGITLTWFWGAGSGRTWRDRRLWFAVCVILLLLASILVTGSRSGALLGAAAVVAGPIFGISRPRRGSARRVDRFVWPVVSLIILVGVVVLNTYFGRAVSLDRASGLDLSTEFRLRSLAAVWEATKTYFPVGAGLGTFDNVFRIVEPFQLLEPTYFNHAHNDFLETVIETGVFGPIIFFCALGWAVRRVVAAGSQRWETARMVRLGLLIFGLVAAASLSDYPARTPMIMATLMIAGCWITAAPRNRDGMSEPGALPVQPDAL
jgi:O-antigen ligase